MSAEVLPFDDEEPSVESDESREEKTDDDAVDRSLRPLEENEGVEIKKKKDDDNDETIVIFE